jgi:hypothetical protein
MWLFYVLVGLFILKTIYDLSPPPPPVYKEPPKPMTTLKPTKLPPSWYPPEPEAPVFTLERILKEYNSPIPDPKDFIALSLEGSGYHVMPMTMSPAVAKAFQKAEEEDTLEIYYGADDLIPDLGLDEEDEDIEAEDLYHYMFYDEIAVLDVHTSKGSCTNFTDIDRNKNDLAAVPIGKMILEDNKYLNDDDYILFTVVQCSSGLSNFEVRFVDTELPAPKESDTITFDAEAVYYNGIPNYVGGDSYEYMDWWNPINKVLVKVSELDKITLSDLM